MVSNFQVEFGRDRNGVVALQRVPVIYGDSSRQVASIISQGSENYLNSEAITTISACVGQPYEFNVSSSDAAGSSTSGTKGAPFITAGTLLVINWSCTKGDMGASIMFDRVTKKDRAQ
jgi:hypothetical protein